MATPINMPQVGQDLETALLTEWHVKEGDTIAVGDIIATVDSDKASFEVEAFTSGTVLKLLFAEGETGKVFEPIAYIGKPNEIVDKGEPADGAHAADEAPTKTDSKASSIERPISNGKLLASPSARRLAKAHQLNLSAIVGSGPAHRIIKRDVLSHVVQMPQVKATPVAREVAKSEGVALEAISGSGPGGRIHKHDVLSSVTRKPTLLQPEPKDEVLYFNKLRRSIADKLTISKQTIPHYYLFVQADVSNTLVVKQKLAEDIGLRVSFTDILIKTVAAGLRKYKEMNAHIDQEKMLLKPRVNIGMAVSVTGGLLVPVIADADQLKLADVAVTTKKLASDARRGIVNTTMQGTFTISNLGMFGITRFTAIINPPECGILSVGVIGKKVVPTSRGIEVADVVELGLAVDHRAVDGALAAQFLNFIKEGVESFNQ
jgi:pyruvate dehydrogenase E2 component (dihydrolipoamide acetyltransferase)